MQNPRIYQAISPRPGDEIQLDERGIKHLVQVLRLREDSPFVLFNGGGQAWQATLLSTGKRQAAARVDAQLESNMESPLYTHLGLGISKGERMDVAIQKAVELGVSEITPLFTRYSMVKLDDKRKEKRHQHWLGIIISACEQCGRNQLPMLNMAADKNDWLQNLATEQKLVLDPRSAKPLSDLVNPVNSVGLYIGPEGGFSDEEVDQARQAGFDSIRLGPRILRTETAVISTITAVQIAWGDLN